MRPTRSSNAFFNDTARLEPFFVKNLENVQGDERDVDPHQRRLRARRDRSDLAMNFGPLNREGGERRLNVLITRARLRCEVFTNLTRRRHRPEPNGVAGRGRVQALPRIRRDGPDSTMAEPTGRGMESPFEEAVAGALRGLGLPRRAAGRRRAFRIDLAIVDPEQPGRYLLGIECDGATYHSALTARDRDRLRQSVLEGLGWQIHRIWSTDWFRSPSEELRRTAAAIERARAGAGVKRPAPQRQTLTLTRGDEPVTESAALVAEPYVLGRGRRHLDALHDVPAVTLAADVVAVVQVESPVHRDEVARRIMDANGVSRLGSRIRAAVDAAVSKAIAGGDVKALGDFLHTPGQTPADVVVRDRSALPSASRSFDVIAPVEVRAAIAETIRTSFGISASDLPLEVCRLFGFGQTSAAMRVAVEDALMDMQTAGTVAERQGTLTLTSLGSTDYQSLL